MIGIFDSGIGGLTVFRKLLNYMPKYDYIYLGDTARVPYGNRSNEMINKFAIQITEFLIAKKCELIIVACNTVTATSLPILQKKFPHTKILGVIVPTIQEAVAQTKNKKIGIIATESTINSSAYDREILKLDPKIKLFKKACPILVPIIEEGLNNHIITRKVIRICTKEMRKNQIDTIILGCTHYPVIKDAFKQVLPKNVNIINSGKECAKKLKNYLAKHPTLDQKLSKNSNYTFYLTEKTPRFKKIAEKILGKKITNIQKIDLS